MAGRQWLAGPRLPVSLVLANALFWLAAVALTRPLPREYFTERDGRVKWESGGGVQFNLKTDVDPLLILAERPFLWPLGADRDAVVLVAAVANLPAAFASAEVTERLGFPRRQGGMRYRRASWYGTLTFAVVASAQSALIGAMVARRGSGSTAS